MRPILLGQRYRERLDRPLRRHGLTPLYIPDNPNVDPRLAGHADLSCFPAGEKIWLAPYLLGTNFAEKLRSFGYSVVFPNYLQAADYPCDAGMNLLNLGKNLIYAKGISCGDIVNFLTSGGEFRLISVRQGYTRCAALPVGEESLITADPGIVLAAETAGLQVLQIEPAHVTLEGFPYGFFGGAGFLLDSDTMAFTGTIENHPDRGRILDFLVKRGFRVKYLTELPLFDIGCAFVLNDTV